MIGVLLTRIAMGFVPSVGSYFFPHGGRRGGPWTRYDSIVVIVGIAVAVALLILSRIRKRTGRAYVRTDTSGSPGLWVKRCIGSIVIVAAFASSGAVVAGYAPKLSSTAVALHQRVGGSSGAPTVRKTRSADTQGKFTRRLIGGGVVGVLLGLAFRKGIIKKFEDDFVPW